MQTRHALNAVGSAAGFAWPTFGLLNGAIGILTPLAMMGLAASGLFLLVAAFIGIASYQLNEKDKVFRESMLKKEQNQLTEKFLNYLLIITNEYLFKNKKKIIDDTDDLASFIIKNLSANISHFPENIKPYLKNLMANRRAIINFITLIRHGFGNVIIINNNFKLKCNSQDEAVKKLLWPENMPVVPPLQQPVVSLTRSDKTIRAVMSFMGFIGGYGSVSGCSAGVIGLVNALTAVTGMAIVLTTPWVVPTILGVSFIFATACAISSYKSCKKKQKKCQLIEHYQQTNDQFNKILQHHKSKLKIEIGIWKSTLQPSQFITSVPAPKPSCNSRIMSVFTSVFTLFSKSSSHRIQPKVTFNQNVLHQVPSLSH